MHRSATVQPALSGRHDQMLKEHPCKEKATHAISATCRKSTASPALATGRDLHDGWEQATTAGGSHNGWGQTTTSAAYVRGARVCEVCVL